MVKIYQLVLSPLRLLEMDFPLTSIFWRVYKLIWKDILHLILQLLMEVTWYFNFRTIFYVIICLDRTSIVPMTIFVITENNIAEFTFYNPLEQVIAKDQEVAFLLILYLCWEKCAYFISLLISNNSNFRLLKYLKKYLDSLVPLIR